MSGTNPLPAGRFPGCPAAPTSTADAAPVNGNGRDSKGRFTKNNPGGPGNPFGGRTAKLRKAALEVVTPEDMQGVFRVLLLKARVRLPERHETAL